MQRYFVEITIRDTDPPDPDRVRQALEAALKHSTAREALDEALFRALHDECIGRGHAGGDLPDGDESTSHDTVQQEHCPNIGGLWLVPSRPDRHARYVLYDLDSEELFSKTIYDSSEEAVEDASQVDDVIVVPFHLGKHDGYLVSSGELEGHYYGLSVDGPAFRAERKLLLQLSEATQQQTPVALSAEQGELLEGLVNLTDAIADQAADRYDIDCLL